MDKTLEVILVAVVLVVAAVIVVGLLQGRAGTFGTFADNQTSSANCGLAESQLSLDCPNIQSSNPTYQKYKPQCWSSPSDAESLAC
ncbi:MAG: hypothetical protein ABEJ36_04230 [Candidatus Nanosalina sp.]